MTHHLAQLNIARLRYPIDAPETQGFVVELEPVNALADEAPGFVWRLQTDDGDATSIRLFEDDLMIVNLSLWESLESWRDFVFSGRHLDVMRKRRAWFERMAAAYSVMWWVPAGHVPTPDEAVQRLELLRESGPTPQAFTMRQAFSPSGEEVATVRD